jgi:hypothetical protein
MNMRKSVVLLSLLIVASLGAIAQEIKVITTVESIVPMGIGRSRIIDSQDSIDYNKFTTDRSDGKDSKQNKVNRSEAKIDNLEETKLLNFYSGVGINFQNIASNDALISSKLTEMLKEGWELVFVTSGVESDAGKDDRKGIFITRYIFKRN